MSDEKPDSGSESASQEQDPIKQIKSEFGRKQDNVMNELNALKAQLGQIADTVISAAATKKQEANGGDDLPDPIMDPKGYKEALKRELRTELDSSISMERERNQTLSTLVSQYPELQQADSELTKTALNIYNQLSPREKQSPAAYRLAVVQAAQETGVLPVNKRSNNKPSGDEDFTISSSSSSNTRRANTNKKEEALDDRTLEFARLLGRPVDSPEYIKNLKSTVSKRKRSWSKFE